MPAQLMTAGGGRCRSSEVLLRVMRYVDRTWPRCSRSPSCCGCDDRRWPWLDHQHRLPRGRAPRDTATRWRPTAPRRLLSSDSTYWWPTANGRSIEPLSCDRNFRRPIAYRRLERAENGPRRALHPWLTPVYEALCANADSTCKARSSRYVTALTGSSAVRQVGARSACARPRGPQFPHKSAVARGSPQEAHRRNGTMRYSAARSLSWQEDWLTSDNAGELGFWMLSELWSRG